MTSPAVRHLFRTRLPQEEADRGTGNDSPPRSLRRNLSTFHLMMIGVGGTVGTGIFFIMSEAVPEAGPAVVVSFVLAAVVAGLTVLCYAELASTIPSSGSSYSFTYATLGELIAFLVGPA
ncbi:MAG: amino acid permease [Galactobacter sp.]